jgi:Ran GTPase-activating protein (RanGAP) involved in mRNA processing and transport
MPSPKNVDLSWNSISTEGMRLLLNSVRGNENIQTFSVAYNPIGKTAKLRAFGNWLRKNTNLHHLDLSGVLQTPE